MYKITHLRNLCLLLTTAFLTVSSLAQERIALLQEPFVILYDPADGSVTDPTFIDLTPLSQGTPKALIQVGEEIWITDQIEDRIDIFDLTGAYLSTISGGLDNIKGLAYVNNSEIWVTNAGSNNGAPGDAIVRFDPDGNNLGFIDTEPDSSFDIIDTGSDVLISYIANSRVERRDYAGVIIENVVAPGIVNFIQQIEINPDNNTLYAAVFSTAGGNGPGLYEFDIDAGNIISYWNLGAMRGVAKLENGNVMYSGNGEVGILNPVNGTTTVISGSGAQYFGRINLSPCTTPPTPTGDSNQAFVEGATIEDIVINPTDVTWFPTENDALNSTNPIAPGTLLVDGETYWAVNIVDGCKSAPFPVTVSVCSIPATPTGDGTQTLPEGSTLDDIVINPTDVTWFATENDALNNTNPLPNTTPVEDGVTYWAVSIDGLCLSTPFPVTVVFPLGLSEFSQYGISIYPNPVSEMLTINSSIFQIEETRIYNIAGQMVLRTTRSNDVAELNVSHLAQGIYLLQVQVNGKVLTSKLIKE